jgi:proline iminopeptidase
MKPMASFASYDGTEMSYRVLGDGRPLVCLPGGPGRAGEYLGDLAAWAGHGGWSSGILAGWGCLPIRRTRRRSASTGSWRTLSRCACIWAWTRWTCSRTRPGAVLATLYAAVYPQHLSRLILVTPGLAAVGVEGTEEQVRAALALRAAAPWYPAALAALERIMAGDMSMEAFRASRPFYYARWDEAARAHATAGVSQRNQAAREGFFAGAAIDPPAARAALAKLTAGPALRGGPGPDGATRRGTGSSTAVQRRDGRCPARRRTLPVG